MSFKMIREAQVVTSLDAETLAHLKNVKEAMRVDSIASVVEGYRPTESDYQTWLDVVRGYAEEEGMSLRRKQDFMDIAFAVLDNDPLMPAENMKAAIANKLWLLNKVAKHDVDIEGAAKAQEEDEELVDVLASFGNRSVDDKPEMSFDDEMADDAEMSFDDMEGSMHTCPECGCEFTDDDEEHCCDDESLGDSVSGAEEIGPLSTEPSYKQQMPDNFPYGEENEEVEVDEPAVAPTPAKSFMHQAITAPRKHVQNALKGVEADGVAAARALKFPKNPHTDKSMANKAWEKGFKGELKDFLGFNVEPKSTSKQKKK